MPAVETDALGSATVRRHILKVHAVSPGAEGAEDRVGFNALALDIPPRRHRPKAHALLPGASDHFGFHALALDIPPRTSPTRLSSWGCPGPTLKQLRAEVSLLGSGDFGSAAPGATIGG
eukprot:CAMPEP_0171229392 /NCGR_PEP_ID=MMETSP0790-20130122/38858_1 /TAXON_ID=2925 /ORGANISM="Alexandrium catenella, Strain OF101" /LENGTH=118 /DNA_ID=CAMNT_0011695573 /DNA_START=67 /DNA_END=423 /DNA_ORIENTATION=+